MKTLLVLLAPTMELATVLKNALLKEGHIQGLVLLVMVFAAHVKLIFDCIFSQLDISTNRLNYKVLQRN